MSNPTEQPAVTPGTPLEQLAAVAAFCTIDLNSNLNSAHKEYMAGEIANGAFQHVLHRHTMMHAALVNAGFTGKHPLFDFPAIPGTGEKTPEIPCAIPSFTLPQGIEKEPKSTIRPKGADTILVSIEAHRPAGLIWNVGQTTLSWIQEGKCVSVGFPELKGWAIFSASKTHYAVRLVLTKN
jgi:hypothetical protein